jgi:hypothetical protein
MKAAFLLSMNEVKINRDFQKQTICQFFGRIMTFYRRKTDFYEKKIGRSAVCQDCPNEKIYLPNF